MRFKIGDQVVRPIIGSGLEVYQIVAVGGTWLNRSYIIGKNSQRYYIQCNGSELYQAPENMKLSEKELAVSLSKKQAKRIK